MFVDFFILYFTLLLPNKQNNYFPVVAIWWLLFSFYFCVVQFVEYQVFDHNILFSIFAMKKSTPIRVSGEDYLVNIFDVW